MDFGIKDKINHSLGNLEIEKLKQKLAKADGKYNKKDIEKVAKNFEAIFIYKMLKEMDNTAHKSGLFGDGLGGDVFKDFLFEEYAQRASESGSVGLWKMVYDGLSRNVKLGNEGNIEGQPEIKNLKPFKNVEKAIKKYDNGTAYDRVERFETIINDASTHYDIDPDILKAVITQESGGNPHAVSKKGARGLMQLMDTTAKDLGVNDVFNPVENIFAGARYLKQLLNRHEGNLEHALASYNAGPSNVDKYNGIPPFEETQKFIEKVKYYVLVYRNRSKT